MRGSTQIEKREDEKKSFHFIGLATLEPKAKAHDELFWGFPLLICLVGLDSTFIEVFS